MKRYAILALSFGLAGLVGCGAAATSGSGADKKDDKSIADKVKDAADKAGEKAGELKDKAGELAQELGGKFTELTAKAGVDLKAIEEKIAELGKLKDDPKDAEGKPLGAEEVKALTEKYTNANGLFAKLKEMVNGLKLENFKDKASFENISKEVTEKFAELKKLLGIE